MRLWHIKKKWNISLLNVKTLSDESTKVHLYICAYRVRHFPSYSCSSLIDPRLLTWSGETDKCDLWR